MTGCSTFGIMSDADRKMGLVRISVIPEPVAAPHNEAGTLRGIRRKSQVTSRDHRGHGLYRKLSCCPLKTQVVRAQPSLVLLEVLEPLRAGA